jgi:hypothetical protein
MSSMRLVKIFSRRFSLEGTRDSRQKHRAADLLSWIFDMRDTGNWARLLAFVTGLVNQELLLQNDYLAAENRILKAHLPSSQPHSVHNLHFLKCPW